MCVRARVKCARRIPLCIVCVLMPRPKGGFGCVRTRRSHTISATRTMCIPNADAAGERTRAQAHTHMLGPMVFVRLGEVDGRARASSFARVRARSPFSASESHTVLVSGVRVGAASVTIAAHVETQHAMMRTRVLIGSVFFFGV